MISVLVGVAIGLAWYFWRQRRRKKFDTENNKQNEHEKINVNVNMRLIGETFDGRSIGVFMEKVYVRRKDFAGWDPLDELLKKN